MWLALVLASSLPGASYLFSDTFFHTHDGFSHLFRIMELDYALRAGLAYPRWAPELAMGYGYPVLNFYAPLTYYVAEVLHLLGFGLIVSFNLTMAIGLLASGIAMYLLANELFGSRSAAFVTAIGYVYLPYQLVDIYVRGALGEAYTFVFLPLVFLCILKVGAMTVVLEFKAEERDGTRSEASGRIEVLLSSPPLQRFGRIARTHYFLLGSVSVAGLVLSHNVMALLAMPIILAFIIWRVYVVEPSQSRQALLGQLFAMILFGFGLSAFYWLPALQERRFTRVDVLLDAFFGGVTAQLFSPWSLVQGSIVYDYGFNWQTSPFKVGLIQMVLAISGVFAFRLARLQRHVIFMYLAFASLLLMMSGMSVAVWQNVPLISFAEFPWRLLAFVGFFTSLLTGAFVTVLSDKKRKGLLAVTIPMLILLISYSSLTGLSPERSQIGESEIDRGTSARFDFNEGAIGTNKAGEYLPVWVLEKPFDIPRAIPTLAGSMLASVPTIDIESWSPYEIKLRSTAQAQSDLRFHTFYFPGWNAALDGDETLLFTSSSLGLMGTKIPPGEHSIMLTYKGTAAQAASNFLSIVCLLYLVVLWWRGTVKALSMSNLLLALAIIIPFSILAKPVLSARAEPIQSMQADFGGKVKLLGWRLDDSGMTSSRQGPFAEQTKGRKVSVTLFWQVLDTLSEDYQVSLNLIGRDKKIWGQEEQVPVYGGTPTTRWEPGELISDSYSVSLDPDAPEGEYSLYLGIQPEGTGTPLRVKDDGKEVLENGALLKISAFELSSPAAAGVSNEPQRKVGVALEGNISVEGFDVVSGQKVVSAGEKLLIDSEPGQTVSLKLAARSLSSNKNDYTISLLLQDHEGNLLADKAFLPVLDVYPTSLWETGKQYEKTLSLDLPAGLQPGGYRLAMEVYNGFDGKRLNDVRTRSGLVELATVKIPMRGTAAPSGIGDLAVWDGRISLLDASWLGREQSSKIVPGSITPLSRGENLRLKLTWRAENTVGEDYTVFIHLIDGLGKVQSQVDTQPGNRTYPTGIWEKGEVIEDELVIGVPQTLLPGKYYLLVGFYSPANLNRLGVMSTSYGVENSALLISQLEAR